MEDASAESTTPDVSEALDVASEAGHILLENGEEISLVEETMTRIANHYGVDESSFFVLSNGIFTTGNSRKCRNKQEKANAAKEQYADVRFIPLKGARLDMVDAVTSLATDVEKHNLSIEETRSRLAAIRSMPTKPHWAQVAASAIGSGCFCAIFGGDTTDCLLSTIAGLLLWVFVIHVSGPYLSKIVGNMCGGALVTFFCIACNEMGASHNMAHVVMGAIIPLIPGVAFANGIKDLTNEDYIAGATRLMDATLVFFGLATGVAIALLVHSRIAGGIIAL